VEKIKISLYELLRCISNAQDLVSPLLSNHQQQVAYLSYYLSRKMGLPVAEQKHIFLAALVHDIGALSMNERLDIIEKEPLHINNHAFIGAKLLKDFKPIQNSTGIIKFHHVPWDNGNGQIYEGKKVPFGSHIIHLADRACLMIKRDKNVLTQIPQILEDINRKSNSIYEPDLVRAMSEICRQEYVWLDLVSSSPANRVNIAMFDIVDLEIDDIIDLAFVFSHIIDFRSKFTARHSASVAKTAERLAQLFGFSPTECKLMLVAGYLHDLGKLAISDSVLEKTAKLNEDEFNEIRMHTYYTYHLLNTVSEFKVITAWAAFHHERLDGNGYPFHINGDNLSLGSRIMAVADVFAAITENRPYRKGMDDIQAAKVLNDAVSSGALDKNVVEVLLDNFQTISELREISHQEASKRYEKFMLGAGEASGN